jgi:hypothetical protein
MTDASDTASAHTSTKLLMEKKSQYGSRVYPFTGRNSVGV